MSYNLSNLFVLVMKEVKCDPVLFGNQVYTETEVRDAQEKAIEQYPRNSFDIYTISEWLDTMYQLGATDERLSILG